MRVLGIDPGNTHSAFALINADCTPIELGKLHNDDMRDLLSGMSPAGLHIAIEMVASYGMAVGADVFETCVWIGRFIECSPPTLMPSWLVYRRDVKLHHCGTARAKDANITQALIDRFAPGQPNRGKGTKKNPGWFYGFKADIWQAYALAVYVADQHQTKAA